MSSLRPSVLLLLLVMALCGNAAVAADEGCPFSQLLKAAGAGVDITATVGGSDAT